ncbi:hypothetical protein MYCTH_2128477 [Thermothelomyces thermophilus ATCC 42464]|uniref:Uncharacterized protein n=1 Tax=Thermothelomyces thermophilus (strain ATCC 42464 / BCRC 31852 / DSM 1799) TaxID=573729 RepID=G2QGK8_THET4|nr:uncharacterized protein MYCTH_2128477 [Thermothelomyces thermophilus ATCC 42464]AEO59418.1 hypothetical protein MYCTH_2128477 [Thermothelomyces thermophilus ATCC 42464]
MVRSGAGLVRPESTSTESVSSFAQFAMLLRPPQREPAVRGAYPPFIQVDKHSRGLALIDPGMEILYNDCDRSLQDLWLGKSGVDRDVVDMETEHMPLTVVLCTS